MTNSPFLELRQAIAGVDRGRVVQLLAVTPGLANNLTDGETPLRQACLKVTNNGALPPVDGEPTAHAIIDDLLLAGADPNGRSKRDGPTPLHAAAFAGNEQLVQRLLAAGADPAATMGSIAGATPLSFALFYAHRSAGATIAHALRAPDDLRSAAGLDDVLGVERLLKINSTLAPGADAGMAFTAPIDDFPPRLGSITEKLTINESLTWAARNGSLAAMGTLVERGADVNANPYRGTALLWAVYGDQVEAINWLVERGADVNLRHDFGGIEHGRSATALHLAAQYGNVGSLDALLAHGADPTITDGAYQATPLGWAEHNGAQGAAERLRKV